MEQRNKPTTSPDDRSPEESDIRQAGITRREQFAQRRATFRDDLRVPRRYAQRQGFSRQGLVRFVLPRREGRPAPPERWPDYTGYGPRGYRRSSERIWEDVCERLTAAPEIDAAEVTVTVRDNEVVLEGTVPARSMKHLAEDLSAETPGVGDVDNRLRVAARREEER